MGLSVAPQRAGTRGGRRARRGPPRSASASASAPPVAVEGPEAWTAAEARRDPSAWTHTLTQPEVEELDAVARAAATSGRPLCELASAGDVPLPLLGPRLAQIRREVVQGRGFFLIRGLPVESWDVATAAAAFYALGLHVGTPVSQNAKGHVLGHVKDIGGDRSKPETRLYTTNAAQPPHTDSCDVVGLLCLHPAKRGGLSNVTSSVSVYNEVLRRRPDLLDVLRSPFHNDRKGEVPEGKLPHFEMPVFCEHEGVVSSMFDRSFIEAAQARFPELPRLTPEQVEALDLAEALCNDPELRLDMQLEPGDIQLLHNHQIWHQRSEYEDFSPEEGAQRHLLRLWLSLPDGRELPPVFAERYGNIELGTTRGGIRVPGTQLVAPLEAA